jgi:hypothetical protein
MPTILAPVVGDHSRYRVSFGPYTGEFVSTDNPSPAEIVAGIQAHLHRQGARGVSGTTLLIIDDEREVTFVGFEKKAWPW